MSQFQIAVLVGSLRRDSFNRKLASAVALLAPPDFSFRHVEIGDLPLYNQDDDANQADSVKRMKAEITAAQGLLFVTAEYNRSIPGVLKNALDHASRPYGKSAWTGKPAGVMGVSVGAMGTAMAQQHRTFPRRHLRRRRTAGRSRPRRMPPLGRSRSVRSSRSSRPTRSAAG